MNYATEFIKLERSTVTNDQSFAAAYLGAQYCRSRGFKVRRKTKALALVGADMLENCCHLEPNALVASMAAPAR